MWPHTQRMCGTPLRSEYTPRRGLYVTLQRAASAPTRVQLRPQDVNSLRKRFHTFR